jgi:hypothetical protein
LNRSSINSIFFQRSTTFLEFESCLCNQQCILSCCCLCILIVITWYHMICVFTRPKLIDFVCCSCDLFVFVFVCCSLFGTIWYAEWLHLYIHCVCVSWFMWLFFSRFLHFFYHTTNHVIQMWIMQALVFSNFFLWNWSWNEMQTMYSQHTQSQSNRITGSIIIE